jgi:hypothetical protein
MASEKHSRVPFLAIEWRSKMIAIGGDLQESRKSYVQLWRTKLMAGGEDLWSE